MWRPCRDHVPKFCVDNHISDADCALEDVSLKCRYTCKHCTCHDDPDLCRNATFAKCARILKHEDLCPKTCGICGSGT